MHDKNNQEANLPQVIEKNVLKKNVIAFLLLGVLLFIGCLVLFWGRDVIVEAYDDIKKMEQENREYKDNSSVQNLYLEEQVSNGDYPKDSLK